MPERLFTIDELAQASGISTRTIRFYSQEKLLPPPADFRGRIALYRQEHLEKLKLIKVLKDKYLPLHLIRKVCADPEKLGHLEEKLKIGGAVFELLGYKPAVLTQKQLARKSRLDPAEIAKLTELGFLFPIPTETGPKYTTDHFEIIESLKRFGKLGFTPQDLALIPAALEKLAGAFFEMGHEKLHDTHAARKSKKAMGVMEAVKANRELIGLIYQQAMRRAIDQHHKKGE